MIIGIGNDARGDDAVGLAVARAIREAGCGAEVREHDGEVAGLMAILRETQTVVLIDAAVSGREPGELQVLDAVASPLPVSLFSTSTHALGLGQAIELARALYQLPRVCRIYAVEGACFDWGTEMTDPVMAAVPEIAARVRTDVATWPAVEGIPAAP